jgi:hypothetical protein
MRVATWNVAAVNNNPFEYWLTHPDPEYTRLMQAVEQFILAPAEQDVPVGAVFSHAMFAELRERMEGEGWAGVAETEALWRTDFSQRRIISGFLKDGSLGKKRLASMPDRYTNMITAADGASCPRPSVINSFTGPMGSTAEWWAQWLHFIFVASIPIAGRDGVAVPKRPVQLLTPIKRAKYPDVSEDEERLSLPLQTLCLALFDAILVHVLNTLAPTSWGPLKAQLVETLVVGKQARTAQIVRETHGGAHVFCLQEASAGLARLLARELAPGRFVVAPEGLDPSRDQNSLVVLDAAVFDASSVREVTDAVAASLAGCSLAPGDLLAFTVRGRGAGEHTFLIASFHGDTNGLQTAPVVAALAAYAARLDADAADAARGARVRLLCGLDANTYADAEGTLDAAKWYPADRFAADCAAAGLLNCWPDGARWAGARTTYNARTYLQPQLNKACRFAEMASKGDRNPKVRARGVPRPAGRAHARASAQRPPSPAPPRGPGLAPPSPRLTRALAPARSARARGVAQDHILCTADLFTVGACTRDNSGDGSYPEERVLPGLSFPSDHCIVVAELQPASA